MTPHTVIAARRAGIEQTESRLREARLVVAACARILVDERRRAATPLGPYETERERARILQFAFDELEKAVDAEGAAARVHDAAVDAATTTSLRDDAAGEVPAINPAISDDKEDPAAPPRIAQFAPRSHGEGSDGLNFGSPEGGR